MRYFQLSFILRRLGTCIAPFLAAVAIASFAAANPTEAPPDVGLAQHTYAVDPINKKNYLVVVDSNNEPLAIRIGSYGTVKIPPGGTINAWAKFASPPGTVNEISVHIAEVMPFESVPIH